MKFIKYIMIQIICVLYLAISISSYSQTRKYAPYSKQKDKSAFGRSRFIYKVYNLSSSDRNQSQLLIYWLFVNDILQFVKESDTKYRAKYELEIYLLDRNMNQLDGFSTIKEIIVSDYEETNSNTLHQKGNVSFTAKPGDYTLRIVLTDLDTQKSLERKIEIKLRDFSLQKLSLGDIIFADIVQIDSHNKLEIHPNLNANFKDPNSNFYAYLEIYPSSKVDSLTLNYSIIDSYDETVFDTTLAFAATEKIIRYIIDLKKTIMSPGRYFLTTEVSANKQRAKMKRRYFVQWGDFPTTVRNIDKAIEPLKMLGKAEELENLENATESEKEEAFIEFWKKRDPTPETEKNEIKDEFYRRIDFCNHHFTVFMLDKEGWETDRGRIFLKYGEPSQVEKHESDLNRPAIEIWYFEKLQQRFIFTDRSGMGDYRLVKIE